MSTQSAPSARIVRGTGSSAAPRSWRRRRTTRARAAREPARHPRSAKGGGRASSTRSRRSCGPRAVRAASRPGRRVSAASGRAVLLTRYVCVIFRGVATGPECAELEGLFWDWLEREHPSVDRSRPATHAPHVFEALGYKNTGVVNTGSIGQSDFLWRARTLSRMVEAWRTVWGLSADGTPDVVRRRRRPPEPVPPGARGPGRANGPEVVPSRPEQTGLRRLSRCPDHLPGHRQDRARRSCAPAPTRTMRQNCARGGKQPRGPFVRLTAPGDAEYCAAKAVQLAPFGRG